MIKINIDKLETIYTEKGSPIYTYNRKPFSGVTYELEGEQLICETTYVDGMEDGPEINWYNNGQMASLNHSKWNRLHGSFKEWYVNGNLKMEGMTELGFVVKRQKWDETGELIENYHIENHPEKMKKLEQTRNIFKQYDIQ